MHGLRLTFGGLDVDEEHGIYEVLAKDGRVVRAETVRSQRSLLEKFLGDGVHWLSRGDEPESPVLYVDGLHEQVQVTAHRFLVLREGHIFWYTMQTRGFPRHGDIDAARIKFRVRDVAGGTLQSRASSSATTWRPIRLRSRLGDRYQEFTLADLRAGKVGFLAGDGTSDITFTIQALDDHGNLSDSDRNDNQNDADPASVSIPVIALKEIEAGQKGALNGDGRLTPDAATLNRWRGASVGGALTIFVELQGGKSGIVVLGEGAVEESLSLSAGASNITATWDAVNDRLSLQGNASATVSDFEAALGALQLQTVRFKEDSYRTISVRPNISGDVPNKDFYVRKVKVGASPKEPRLSVGGFTRILATAERPLVLRESHLLVDDADTVLANGKVDASRIKFRVTALVGGTLQKRISASADWVEMTKAVVNGVSQDYYAFTLADLQDGLISFLPSSGASTLIFKIQAADDGDPGVSSSPPHLSDSDRSTPNPDPESVSVSVVALKEIDAGKEMPVNDDRRATSGDGALTPGDAILDGWISAATGSRLSVLVRLEGGRKGDVLFLEDGHDIASIVSIRSSWSWDDSTGIGILSLQSDGSATPDDFQTVLNALALRTVRFPSASARTISVRPDMTAEVRKKDYYARDVLIRSPAAPYVGVQKMSHLKFGTDDRAILSSSEFLVEDFDTSASRVTIVMRELSSGVTLQKRNAVSGVYRDIKPESDGSLEFTLEDLQQDLIAVYSSNPTGKMIVFTLEAKDDDGHWSDVGESNTHQRGVRSFSLTGVLPLSPEELEVDLETGYQKAFPFGNVEKMIETARSNGNGDGSLHIVLAHAVSGDRLVMRKSVSGITGAWSEGEHSYTLTVSDGATTSAQIDQALAQIYYRASESVGEKERELVISWVDGASTETLLFRIPLGNRPPVLRNWGISARYHDITPAPGATEAPLDLGYHPFAEYMPDILDNEGKVVRLEVVLVDKAGGVLSVDERVFLSQQLLDRVRVEGLVLRELRSSDGKARALVLESADGRTPVSPEFMSRILQGLSYRHGAAGRDGDVGERREISVSVFDGEAYSQTRTMEVRLVDKTPDPAKYVNTFIGTAFQKRMGVAGLSGNKAGMTFPGASYPFGMVKFSPDTDGGRHGFFRNGGYRRDSGKGNMRFGLQFLSGPGCPVAGVGHFKVGVSGRGEASDDWSTSDESSAPGYYQVGVKDERRRSCRLSYQR